MGMNQDAEVAEVLAANERFYDAFRSGDLAAMDALWSERAAVCVYHPEWPGITGRDEVMASWHQIMVLGEPPMVFAKSPTVIRQGKSAIVFCTEVIDGHEVTASNVFVSENGIWKLTCHYARSLNLGGEDTTDDADDAEGGDDGRA